MLRKHCPDACPAAEGVMNNTASHHHSRRSHVSQWGLGALASLGMLSGGCFSEPTVGGEGSSSSASSENTSEAGTTGLGPESSTSSGPQSTGTTRGPSSSSSSTTSSGSEDTGLETDPGSSTSGGLETGGVTTGGVGGLCTDFTDAFDGAAVHPAWMTEWPSAVEQTGGQTVFTLTELENDEYPRRVLPWAALGGDEMDSITFRIQPGATPALVGTQLNLVVEGPPGNDVTFSLNQTGGLEYRITSTEDGVTTVLVNGDDASDFQSGGWMQAAILQGSVAFDVLDSDGEVVNSMAIVTLPFDVEESRIGFAANNWGPLPSPVEIAVDTFELECF